MSMRRLSWARGDQVSILVSFSSCSALGGVRGGGGQGGPLSRFYLSTA